MTGLIPLKKNRVLQLSIGVSVLAHVVLLFPIGESCSHLFRRAVQPLEAVVVDVTALEAKPASASRDVPLPTAVRGKGRGGRQRDDVAAAAAVREAVTTRPEVGVTRQEPAPVPVSPEASTPAVDTAGPASQAEPSDVEEPPGSLKALPPPLRGAGEFVAKEWEQLTYRIRMLGLPVGDAVLEASNRRGEVNISLRVKSVPPFSSIYPVDDLIETRHAGGNFIITKIRQQEGDFRSNRGFTIFLRDRKVFWMDLLALRSVTEAIPNGDVVDILSGLYYLRNRPLQVGRDELLHVYDSDTYSELPVQVLRKERLELPGFGPVETLVIRPHLKTEGIFRRTGDVTVWLTDDENKSPVKVETEIALGKVTAELVSADTDSATKQERAVAAKRAKSGDRL